MEVRRTAPVKLVVPDEYHNDLHETADQFLYYRRNRPSASGLDPEGEGRKLR